MLSIKPKGFLMNKYCLNCGEEELIYSGDHDVSDEDSEYSIISNFTCVSCEAFIEVHRK